MAIREASVSVVICTYADERWPDLVACVESVQRQIVTPCEIIIVVDNNADLLARVEDAFDGVVALANSGSPGAAGSRNAGIAVARGEIVAFIDDDAEAEPDWLEHLIAAYTDARVLGVGGHITPAWPGRRPAWFPPEFDWVIGCTYAGMAAEPHPVRNAIAANMSMRRAAMVELGGFREGFGNVKTGTLRPTHVLFQPRCGDEETELCIRARRRWTRSLWLYTPRARVRHRVPRSRISYRYFLRRCYDEGLGKAALVGLWGAADSLASERAYTRRIVPRGVCRGVADTLLRGDEAGMMRAVAIVIGLATTVSAYGLGTITRMARTWTA